MLDNFTAVARAAARYTHELVLDDVTDLDLLEYGDEGRVVLISRCEARLRKLVTKYASVPDAADREDLQQAAVLGFLEALAKFDPTRGAHPFTYAHTTIVDALVSANVAASPKPVQQKAHKRYVAAMKATDKDPVQAREWSRLQRLTGHALLEESDAGNRLAADILDDRIASYERRGLDVTASLAEADRGLEPAVFDAIHESVTYLDAPLADSPEADAGTSHDIVGSEAPQEAYEAVEARAALVQMFDVLDERERAIVSGLYGVDSPERTASELADEYGVSRPRILNIRKAALVKLKKVAA